jgi:large subunit ribosomal protein L10
MNRTEKQELANELKDRFARAKVAIFADYKGLTATQADDLRRQLRATEAEVKVIKNNLGRLISKDGAMGADAKGVLDATVGPTLVAFAFKDPAATAKVIHKFSKDNEALKLKDSLFGAKLMSASSIADLANLPSREVLLAKLLGTLNAPITNFVGVLAAVPRGLVTVLGAIEKKKAESQG